MPIRLRLTVAFALAMIAVLAAAALFVYLRQRADLNDAIDHALRSRSNDVTALISGPDADLEEVRGNHLTSSAASFIQVLAPDGRRLDRTGGFEGPALGPADAQRASGRAAVIERSIPALGGEARMLTRRIETRGQAFVVVAGTSLDQRDNTLSGLRTSFLIGGSIAVLLASGIGYVLAAAGFRPIEAMRERASRVSLTHGAERLPLPGAHDEVRRLGETLNEMLARLRGSFERERQFVADASHELRTPIAVLKTELETALRDEDAAPKIRASLVTALDEVDHLSQLAGDLLLIAQAADGRLPVRRENVEIRELFEHTRARFADRARAQGREIPVEVANGLQASLDPLRVRQALGNLVDNALRHGGGNVRLAAREDNGAVELDVGDDGSGFGADFRPRAFERFSRGDGARTESGAGLGLAIVRVIAEAHGGTAAIVNGSSRGATIRIRLPAAADEPR